MSQAGQYCWRIDEANVLLGRFALGLQGNVRVTSAFPPIATEQRTFQVGRLGPVSDL